MLVLSVLLAALCFACLAVCVAWELHDLLARREWLGDAAAALGGAGSLLTALWLFFPLAAGIATLFLEPVCRAVERRWYPGMPPTQGAPISSQVRDGSGLAVRLIGLSVLGIVVALLLPGVGLFIGWAINGWAAGRGLFAAVAMRRMTRADALALYKANRLDAFQVGTLMAIASSVPLVNLLVPVIGTASMVHLVMHPRSSRQAA